MKHVPHGDFTVLSFRTKASPEAFIASVFTGGQLEVAGPRDHVASQFESHPPN